MNKVRVIASTKNWIDSRSVEALEQISRYRGVSRVVGLPDLSVGNVPNGMSFLSKDRIYPHLIGGDIGCGMSLFQVPIKSKKIKVDRFVKYLNKIESLDDIEIEQESMGYHLGSIGKGNHFSELHIVDNIVNQTMFDDLQINKDSLYVLVHSGSREFGQIVFNRVAGSYESNQGLSQDEAKDYLLSHDKALKYASKSRKEIAIRLLKAIKLDTNFSTISDTAHNSILRVQDGWLHQKGATPTNKGAVIIAGSRGSLSYLVMPKSDTSYSNNTLAHGAGRKWERNSAKAKLEKRYTKENLKRTSIGSRVLCSDTKLLYEEAPEVYKNIDIVIDDLVQANLVDVIASFTPILTYKE